MIREQDLMEAIAECQGERSPNAHTCIKLAAYYTIRDAMFPKREAVEYSYADMPISIDSGTEFANAIRRLEPEDVWPVMDELMSVLRTMVPRLYESVMRRLV